MRIRTHAPRQRDPGRRVEVYLSERGGHREGVVEPGHILRAIPVLLKCHAADVAHAPTGHGDRALAEPCTVAVTLACTAKLMAMPLLDR